MSSLRPRSLLVAPSRAPPRAFGAGKAAEMRSAKIWAKRSARRSNGCEESLAIAQLCRSPGIAQLRVGRYASRFCFVDQIEKALNGGTVSCVRREAHLEAQPEKLPRMAPFGLHDRDENLSLEALTGLRSSAEKPRGRESSEAQAHCGSLGWTGNAFASATSLATFARSASCSVWLIGPFRPNPIACSSSACRRASPQSRRARAVRIASRTSAALASISGPCRFASRCVASAASPLSPFTARSPGCRVGRLRPRTPASAVRTGRPRQTSRRPDLVLGHGRLGRRGGAYEAVGGGSGEARFHRTNRNGLARKALIRSRIGTHVVPVWYPTGTFRCVYAGVFGYLHQASAANMPRQFGRLGTLWASYHRNTIPQKCRDPCSASEACSAALADAIDGAAVDGGRASAIVRHL